MIDPRFVPITPTGCHHMMKKLGASEGVKAYRKRANAPEVTCSNCGQAPVWRLAGLGMC